jgi:glycosyltransferase involved in cell wall biosynthesis
MTTVHPPDDARIFYRMCQPLAQRGCWITLVAPENNVSITDAFVHHPPQAYQDSLVRLSPFNTLLGKASRLKRAYLAYRAALYANADIYHFHDPELLPVGFALKARKPHAKVIYDVHEDYPAQMYVKYWIPSTIRPLVAKGMHQMNAIANWNLDGIVTADPAVASSFTPEKTMVFYNFPICDFFQIPPIPKQYDVVYLGGLSARTGMFVFLDALAILKATGIIVTACIAGYTDGTEGLAALCSGIRLRGLSSQVLMMGRIPHHHVPVFLHSGRIGLVALQPIAKFLSNIPTKLFEYWACGLPVLASDLPPTRPFLKDGANSLLFDPTNVVDLADRLSWLLTHPTERDKMGQYGHAQVATEWNNETQVTQLLQFYNRLVQP